MSHSKGDADVNVNDNVDYNVDESKKKNEESNNIENLTLLQHSSLSPDVVRRIKQKPIDDLIFLKDGESFDPYKVKQEDETTLKKHRSKNFCSSLC